MPGRICRRVQRLSTAYLQNELSEAARRRIEGHLAVCEACREELRLVQLVVRSVGGLKLAPVPAGLRAAVQARIAAELQRNGTRVPGYPPPAAPALIWRRLGRPAWAAVALLLLGAGLVWWRGWAIERTGEWANGRMSEQANVAGSQVRKHAEPGNDPTPPRVAYALSSPDAPLPAEAESPDGTGGSVTPSTGPSQPRQAHPSQSGPRSTGSAATSAAAPKQRLRHSRKPPSPSPRVAAAEPRSRRAAAPAPIPPLRSMLQRAAQGGSSTMGFAVPDEKENPQGRSRGTPQGSTTLDVTQTEGDEGQGTRDEGPESDPPSPRSTDPESGVVSGP
jgi:hypothetical protein